MKLSIKRLKPRNPLVAPGLFRRAGSHRPGGRTERRLGKERLRRELAQLGALSP